MDQTAKVVLVLLLLLIFGRDCSGPEGTTGKTQPAPGPTNVETNPDPNPPDPLAEYETAVNYESQFYKTRKTENANIAIKSFLAYYRNAPNGFYACVALLKAGELYYRIGNVPEARNILNAIRRRPDFVRDYASSLAKLARLIGE